MLQMPEAKSALATGAGSGIGRATALACAAQRASLTLADVDLASVEATDAQVREQVARLVAVAVDAYGRADGAVNNAGLSGPGGKRLADYDEADWQLIMDVNLKGVWLCMKAEIGQMLRQGGGSIVNTASNAGLVGSRGLGLYSDSKHGVVGLTGSAALQYAADGTRANAVCPGYIDTPMVRRFAAATPDMLDSIAAASPVGRIARPEEIGAAVVWLLSDAATYVTGVTRPVDGGWTAL